MAVKGSNSQSGFTLTEGLVVMTALMVLAGALLRQVDRIQRGGETREEAAQLLQAEGVRALREVQKELSRSGQVTLDGRAYPHVFADGVPGDAAFARHAHAAASASAGENAGGTEAAWDREIVLAVPHDRDEDGRADFGEDGEILWSGDEVSFVRVAGEDGIPVLQRRINGGAPEEIARWVERVQFDDRDSSRFTVPGGSVRVRIFFRRPDGMGDSQRYSVQAIVPLVNG